MQGRFEHSTRVLDFARQLVAEYDEHQKAEDQKYFRSRPLYKVWTSIKLKCSSGKYVPGNHDTNHSICERWNESPGGYENFEADMSPRPRGHKLVLIDPAGEYGPDNCEWRPK